VTGGPQNGRKRRWTFNLHAVFPRQSLCAAETQPYIIELKEFIIIKPICQDEF